MTVRKAMRSNSMLTYGTMTGLAVLAAVVLVFGQVPAQTRMVGFPQDWSHHHLVFSNPGTFQQAVQNGTTDRFLRITRDPRFLMQQFHRAAAGAPVTVPDKAVRRHPMNRDWSMYLGNNGEVGAGNYPAKYSFGTGNASCSDFVAFNTSLPGGSAQASVIAYSNLYSGSVGSGGCGTTGVPSVFWAYNTGGTVSTSVALSGDGSQFAFIHTPTSGAASLVVLKWKSGEGTDAGSPVAPHTQTTSPSAYNTCRSSGTSCQLTLAFANGNNDSISSPFYDYGSDTLYVGDNNGKVHKFTNVFTGTPAEAGSPWPVAVGTTQLAGPVYDGTHILVGNASSVLYSITASSGAIAGTSSSLGATPGIVDAPLIDVSVGTVYVSVGNDNNGGCAFVFKHSAVYKFASTSVSGAGSRLELGCENGSTPMYSGAFDNAYFTSGPSAGNLYVCGSYTATLYQISTSTFTSPNNLALGILNTATCSPVTEIFNSPHDWLFLGVTANGDQFFSGCSGACLYNFDVAGSFPSAATAGLAATGGASGIIVDNTAATSGASQIYYSPLGNQACGGNGSAGAGTGGCAVQASQAAP